MAFHMPLTLIPQAPDACRCLISRRHRNGPTFLSPYPAICRVQAANTYPQLTILGETMIIFVQFGIMICQFIPMCQWSFVTVWEFHYDEITRQIHFSN